VLYKSGVSGVFGRFLYKGSPSNAAPVQKTGIAKASVSKNPRVAAAKPKLQLLLITSGSDEWEAS